VKSLRRILYQSLKDERGSASVEFVALAIPLFIPLFLYINSFAAMSDGQDSLRTLARESARGFVTSANDQIAYEVANEIFTKGADILGYSDEIHQGLIEMQIQCSLRPCISPNASVTVSMIRLSHNSPSIKVSAIEYVSPWA
jgi:Flp pilus assembly protein TadG